MGWFSKEKVKESLQARVVKAVDNVVTPKSEFANNINSIDALYVVTLFMGAIGFSLLLGAGGNGLFVAFLGAFVFISRPVKSALVPKFYDFIASKVGWLPYEAALRADAVARGVLTPDGRPVQASGGGDPLAVQVAIAQAAAPASPVNAAPSVAQTAAVDAVTTGDAVAVTATESAPAEEEKVRRLLEMWKGLPDDDQLDRAVQIAETVARFGVTLDLNAIHAAKHPGFAATKVLTGLCGRMG